MKKLIIIVLSICIAVAAFVLFKNFQYQTLLSSGANLSIVRNPEKSIIHQKIESIPKYDPNSTNNFSIDLRGSDLTNFDLSNNFTELMYADFDDNTQWPLILPEDFNPKLISEAGKNPGLGIRELHNRGITGKGIGLAIIDQPLLVNHVEYQKQLKLYEEIHVTKDCLAQMHGPAVASIAVGKTVGVAPEADLYYIAQFHWTRLPLGKIEFDFSWLAKSIYRILDVNKSLPLEKKIRVISISVGWSPNQKGYKNMLEAIEKAKTEGVFVISSSLGNTYGLFFHGLGRYPLDDPDLVSSYQEGSWWKKNPRFQSENTLMVPMDSRCVASPTGEKDYVFYSTGGWSWSIPYIAGLYTLACQVKTDITPEQFWEVAIKTGEEFKVNDMRFGFIANPIKLIEYLEKI